MKLVYDMTKVFKPGGALNSLALMVDGGKVDTELVRFPQLQQLMVSAHASNATNSQDTSCSSSNSSSMQLLCVYDHTLTLDFRKQSFSETKIPTACTTSSNTFLAGFFELL